MRSRVSALCLSACCVATACGQALPVQGTDRTILPGLTDDSCVPLQIDGLLGSGSADWPAATGLQTGRLTRDGIESTCAAIKPCPGVFTALGARRFDAYTFNNTSGAAQCVRFLLTGNGGSPGLFMVAYTGATYNPLNPLCTNYRADAGSSAFSGANALQPMDINIAAGASITVTIQEVDPASGAQPYRLYIQGFPCNIAPNGVLISARLGFASTASLWAGASGTQTGRLTRDAVASACSATKPCPGEFTAVGSRRFDRYPIFNPYTTARCVTVRMVSSDTQVFGVAYSGDYNPASRCTNYLADIGSSSSEVGREMSFTIAPRATVNVVFHEVEPTGVPAADVRYAFSISGLENPLQTSPTCYANCDNSTNAPILNALDFSCFLLRYRAGCP